MARRGENIHKRKDGRWEGRYIKARTPDRRICWGYIYGTTYAEVKQRLIHKKSEYGGWKVIDEKNVQEQRFVQLVCEQTKKQKPDIVLHDSGVLVAQTIYGFDSSVMKKIEKFLREQKPELLHHQKFLENGTAERAKESGTEQNYNMIDGCVNNNPKKPRIIGNRISVLDRLHIKLEERKQKSQPQQQQQQERSRKN